MLSAEQKRVLGIALGDKEMGEEIGDQILPAAEAVADIADPGIATAEDVANKVNELMASLRLAGLLKI